jgi:hypothetical protein
LTLLDKPSEIEAIFAGSDLRSRAPPPAAAGPGSGHRAVTD